jgi:hypothetical protein
MPSVYDCSPLFRLLSFHHPDDEPFDQLAAWLMPCLFFDYECPSLCP